MLKNTGILKGLARQKLISRRRREAGKPDKFPMSTYFPLRTYTAGKVPSCGTFLPTVAPLEEHLCAASGSHGSMSPEGITETRRAQTRLGLDQECCGDNKQGNFVDYTINTISSVQAPPHKYPLRLRPRTVCKELQQSRSRRCQGWDGSCTSCGDWGCTS